MSHAGGGNAQIRPYNRFGAHRAAPLAAGVTTGSHGVGYAALTPAVRSVISEDLVAIHALVATGDYAIVRYSARTPDGSLGSGIFRFGEDVNAFIMEGLRSLAV
jgi:hypothetical protein